MTLNTREGILSQGRNSFVLIGGSTVISNGTGLATANNGSIFSYDNNHLTGNVIDGAPTALLTLK